MQSSELFQSFERQCDCVSLNINKGGWARVRFGDVADRSRNQADQTDGSIERYVAGGHFDDATLEVTRSGDPDDGGMGSTFTYTFSPSDVLYVSASWYLRKVGVATFDGVVADKTYVIKTREPKILDQRFVPWILLSDRLHDYAAAQSTGSMNARLLWSTLADFEFDLPPLDEQKRIADLLWSLERHHEVVKVSFASAQQVLSRTRAALFDAKSKTIPASEAFSITIGRQRAPKYQTGDDLIPYIRSANVTRSGINIEDVKSMNFTAKEQLKFGLKTGDVLVSEASASASAVGMPAVWNNEIQTVVGFQNTLLRFRALDGITLPGFVEQWCRWAFESGEFLAAASGTNIRHIGVGGASGMQVRVPRLEDQSLFLEQINTIAASVDSARLEVKTLRSLGAAILTEVFGGN